MGTCVQVTAVGLLVVVQVAVAMAEVMEVDVAVAEVWLR